MMWKEKYKIGIDLIDGQHEELFSRVNDFVVTLRSSDQWSDKAGKVGETMVFMQNYVVTHFASEEAYQKLIGYPGYEDHKKIHTAFTNEVADFADRFQSHGYEEEAVNRFAGKLLAWLINHVAAEDQKIARFVSEQNAGKKGV